MNGWLPDPSPTTLIPPNRDHPFFNFATQMPFDYQAQAWCAANAAWLADLALLAYDDPQHVAASLRQVGLRLAGKQPVAVPGGSAQCYVAHDEHVVLVAFRGSEVPLTGSSRGFLRKAFDSLQDTLTNARIELTAAPGGGRVHAGFAAGLDEIWDTLQDGWLRPLLDAPEGRRLWLTGHSLGGAMASIAATRLPPPAGLYTFGAPRTGDAAFAARLDALPAWRVVLRDDLVTRVPPARPDQRLPWVPAGYTHGGQALFIDAEGQAHASAGHDEAPPATLLDLAAGLTSPLEFLAGRLGPESGLPALLDHLLSGDAGRDTRALARALYDHAPLYYALAMRHLAGVP